MVHLDEDAARGRAIRFVCCWAHLVRFFVSSYLTGSGIATLVKNSLLNTDLHSTFLGRPM